MSNNILDSFFPSTLNKEFHQILVTKQETLAIARDGVTAQKFKRLLSFDGDLPIIQDDCVVIELEKKYQFTNYQTVLSEAGEQPYRIDTIERFQKVALWIKNNCPFKELMKESKKQEAQVIFEIIATPSLRDQYIVSEEYHRMARELFNNPFVNGKLGNITYLINTRFPASNWGNSDTENLPESLLQKFNYYIERENEQWIEKIEEEQLLLGEYLEEDIIDTLTTVTSDENSKKSKTTIVTEEE